MFHKPNRKKNFHFKYKKGLFYLNHLDVVEPLSNFTANHSIHENQSTFHDDPK